MKNVYKMSERPSHTVPHRVGVKITALIGKIKINE